MKKIKYSLNRIFFFIVLSILLLSSSNLFATTTETVSSLKSAMVLIIVYDKSGTETDREGGFFIDNHGRIITSASLLEDVYSAEVFSNFQYYGTVTVLKQDESLNIALLQVEAREEQYLEMALDYEVKENDEVIFVGHQFGEEKILLQGMVKALSSDIEEIKMIYTTVPVIPGLATGALLNTAGEVIGVSTSKILEGQTVNAVGMKSIRAFFSVEDSSHQLYPPYSRVWFWYAIKWIKTEIIGGLVSFGGMKIIAVISGILIISFFIQWILERNKW